MMSVSLDDAATALGFVSASCDRDTWVKLGMSIKAEFGDTGFEVWDSWSATGDNYKAADARAAWKSIKQSGTVSIAFLLKVAKENGYTIQKIELSDAQKQKQADEYKARKIKREQEEKSERARVARWHKKISALSEKLFSDYIRPKGRSAYLDNKKIDMFGIGFFKQSLIILIDSKNEKIKIIDQASDISGFFTALNYEQFKADDKWFMHCKKNTIAVPVRDVNDVLCNIQLIFSAGKKQFIKNGRKSKCFHLVGDVSVGCWLLAAEGYATAASLHMASGDPVAVAFDAGNLVKVAALLKQKYPNKTLLICGDNDSQKEKNTGKESAEKAAMSCGGRFCVPDFEVTE